MCAPIQGKSAEELFERIVGYARQYKTFEGKMPDTLQAEVETLESLPREQLSVLQDMISDTGRQLKYIEAPVAAMQGGLDQPLYLNSSTVIYETVPNAHKSYKVYPQSGHILTLGAEQAEVFEDVYRFLETLQWGERD